MPLQQAILGLEKARVRDLLKYYTPSANVIISSRPGSFQDTKSFDATTIEYVPAIAEAADVKDTSWVESQDHETLKPAVGKDEGVTCEEAHNRRSILGLPSAAPFSTSINEYPPLQPILEEGDGDYCVQHSDPFSAVDDCGTIPSDSQLLKNDPTLMAFTQLGAFRTNCQRSFISLMDDKKQYLIAEATRTVSINDPGVYDESDPGEAIYLGARTLDQHWGVCPNTIQVFTALDDSLDLDTELIVANKTCYVMNDLAAIPAFKERPYVAGWPHMRFYAEVPILSPTGYVIGTYCVVDDKPREGLDKKSFDALNEIAAAIMNHLALIRTQFSLQRAGEMVKRLGMFVEAKALSPVEFGGRESGTDDGSRYSQHEHEVGCAETTATNSRTDLTTSPSPTTLATEFTNELESKAHKPTTPSTKTASSTSDTFRPRERKLSMDETPQNIESVAASGTKALFSRASSLLRKALDLDGIVFIDASFRDIESPDGVTKIIPPEYKLHNMPQTPDSESTDRSEWLEDPRKGFVNKTDKSDAYPKHQRAAVSDVLGYAAVSNLPFSGTSETFQQVSLPQSTLRSLLRQYQTGKIFEFEPDGSLTQNLENSYVNEQGQSSSLRFQERERKWAAHLKAVCPGAQSIIFLPLWDPQRDQWFSGSLVWTNDRTRVFGQEEISFLTAFGSCIMAEKSRLDALNADRLKADFISSVSHELRSPLHGVLASAEALQNTSTGYLQDDMIRTIRICGEALLDTMDQILDYAKMSKREHIHTQANGEIVSRKSQSTIRKSQSLDMSALVESVVDAIFAGHYYRKATTEPQPSQASNTTISIGDVMVILSIDGMDSWVFLSQIGSWKRILMNIFGNALKYTDSGFVHVMLRSRPGIDDSSTSTILLQVDDSGIGMSRDFMKYQLYTPFAQENQIAVGTGLGLSIVRQLVTDLGGEIDVQSEKGYGTSVKVIVPLLPSSEPPEQHFIEATSMISDIGRRTKNLKLCLIGFDHYPDMEIAPNGILSPMSRRMLANKSSMNSLCTDWFGMTVSAAPSFDTAEGDILIKLRSKTNPSREAWKGQPLIILDDRTSSKQKTEKGVFHLSLPVGPHKLAIVLEQCLNYVLASKHTRPPTAATHLSTSNSISHIDLAAIVPDRNPQDQAPITTTIQLKRSNTALRAASIDENDNVDAPIPQPISASAKPEPQRSKVLLVEDNIINMKLLTNYMKKAKESAATASNGLEAVQLYKATPSAFKVIFMDISMPVMDGLTAAREIRKLEDLSGLPRTRIVALTCFSSEEYQRDAALSGIDTFLIKPVPMKMLMPILELDPEEFGVGS